jgi:exosortase F-associated protein
VAVVAFVFIRIYQGSLFYDPFIRFYNLTYHDMYPPDVDFFKLILNTSARYWLNSLLSIGLIYMLFRKRNILKFSFFFYGLAFIVLMITFGIMEAYLSPDLYMIFFYIRRFLIQPIFILLLLPAFYYQQINQNK